MADQEGTPSKSRAQSKSKSRPPAPERANSDPDQGYESRSRSASRRRRRQNQRQKPGAKGQASAGKSKAQSMAAVQEQPEQEEEEADEEIDEWVQQGYKPKSQWLTNPETRDTTETQPFDWIKPASQGMMGPVTYAKMMRGEIPWQGPPPSQPYNTTQGVDAKLDGANGADPMDQDGLKLRIELNLDIEIELKAHIHGDLTLALM
ncbi:hypothetical protein OHC33_003356 [Knufia fluminis]|uniref:Uncharacterized protein n=2 Tax=Knufia TaxID=430999 RepID=A0AAN8IAL4_9EURO|nr:hypothetical protein OHC33_003356 [Knufia fluminis]